MSELRFIDFFAGIGGMRSGLEQAGHKCLGFCESDKYAVKSYTSMYLLNEEQRKSLSKLSSGRRSKEILKDEYRNGEWYADDIRNVHAGDIPGGVNCWCFGFPCNDFSLAGHRAGLSGTRSSLVQEIFRLLEEQEGKDRPEWLICENVKGMLSSNGGLDYLSILSELDRFGYDIEWQDINSAWFVPQNRERIYTIGHLREYGSAKVLPIKGTDGENTVSIIGHRKGYRRNGQTFSQDGITETMSTGQGGGRLLHVALPCFIDMQMHSGFNTTNKSRAITARQLKGSTHRNAEISGVVVHVPMLNDNGDHNPMYVELDDGTLAYAIWYEKFGCYVTIRKLTPRECFRLQGFSDELFDKAQFVNSDSQLYKQSGNAVTVNVAQAIGEKIKSI